MLRLDIINYQDINILVFYGNCNTNFMIKIYFNSNQTALHFLCQNAVNLVNIVIITGDFNIRDSDWDLLAYYHSMHTDDLMTITDSLGLELFPSSNPGLTRFMDNPQDSNSIVMPQVNFLQKITFDKLYNNGFLIGVHSRTLFIFSECNTI